MRLFGTEIQFSVGTAATSRRSASAQSDLKNPTEWLVNSLIGMAQSATGIHVTPLKALGVATVFGCVRVLADAVSSLPLEVRQRKGRKRRVATEHPLFNVLGLRPNEDMTSRDMRFAVQANLSLYGRGFAEVMKLDGLPAGLYPIESSRVDLQLQPDNRRPQFRLLDKPGVRLEASDLIYLRGMTFSGVAALNTTSLARDCIALAIAMQDNASKFFGNGSRPNGVLKHPMSLSEGAQDRLKAQFEENASGQNLYRLLLLEEGLEYVATRSENKDSQFLESKDAQNLEICRIFGVPPHKLGILNSQPRANIEEENIGFVMDRIRPISVGWEQELTVKLFSQAELDAGYYAHIDLDAMLRGNMTARYTAYGIGRQWGWLSANDVRDKEGEDDIEGGDTYLQPTNMVDASKATEIQMKQSEKGAAAPQSEGGVGGKPNNAAT